MRFPVISKTLAAVLASTVLAAAAHSQTLLNVSYDVSRELYKDINPAFSAYIRQQQQQDVSVNQSHGGSSRQAMAVAAGLEADIVTMNQSPDIDMLVSNGLVDSNWREQFPHQATPYTTTSVFLVRKGNPKNIRDWDDLTRAGLTVIVPNPKTSGNGRYTYVAAWGYALEKTGSDAGAEQFVRALLGNVPVLDGGGRGATTTFTQRGVGDVLVTFENEAILIAQELGSAGFDIVYPSLSVDASAPVAIVKRVTERRSTTALARQYLDFLFSIEGQQIIAKHNFRPRNVDVLAVNASRFPAVKTFTVDEKLGGWEAVNQRHFAEGGLFDQIMVSR